MHSSVLAGPPDAGLPLWHENGVRHRQVRGSVTVEDKLRLHHQRLHPREPRLSPRLRNSVSACVTRAEIVTPDVCARPRPPVPPGAGTLTVNPPLPSGPSRRPAEAWST